MLKMSSSKIIAQVIKKDNEYLDSKKLELPLYLKMIPDTRFSKASTPVFGFFPVQLFSSPP